MKRKTFIETGLMGSLLMAAARPSSLQKKLVSPVQENMAALQVINAGVGGNNTIDLMARIEQDCLLQKPALVIFMAGTNDMNSKKFVPLPDYEKNMQQMIGQMKKIGAAVLLINLLPVYEPYLFTRHEKSFYEPEGHGGRLKQMNATIEQLATRNKIAHLDLHHIFERTGNIGTDASSLLKNEANSKTTDGVHPTPDGYRVMAISVYAQLERYELATKKKIVCFGDSITKGDGVEGGENYPSYLQKLLT